MLTATLILVALVVVLGSWCYGWALGQAVAELLGYGDDEE